MTALADLAVAETYRSVASELAAVHGVPRDPATGLPQEMLIVGMGKLGGCELNVSSDIDLIMLYGEEGETDGPRRISHHEFYGRLTRRMMPVLSGGRRQRPGLPHRPAAAPGRRRRPAGLEPGRAGTLPDRPGPRMGALCLAQGPAHARPRLRGQRQRPAGAAAGKPARALRVPQVFRLRRAGRAARCASASARTGSAAPARNGIDSANNIKLGDGGIREIELWSSWPS